MRFRIRPQSSMNTNSTNYFGKTSPTENFLSFLSRIILGLLAMAYIIIGFDGAARTKFIPTKEHLDFVSENLPTVNLAIILALSLLVLLLQRSPGKGLFRAVAFQKLGLILVMSGIVIMLAQPFWAVGLPNLHSLKIEGETTNQEVVVVKINMGHPRKYRVCDFGATITPIENPSAAVNICQIPRDIWKTLGIGDRLILTGEQTEYGLKYSKITLASQ